ncbi:DUF7341 domain-containing protein [Glaciibacter psychrotolerans]|uniref:DUF7341 domain-containing protein n=1 Tax=Glaciibacter psychrotolerans TaxID=670054 RepID=A0A7Z0ED24_9MICO|nr:hypothetical protein [Leifsonia psychrotolerans]NYJ19186.1 hypothetical protein [Leifsonia psychrotolerans]
MSDLLSAVDALTQPVRSMVIQSNDAGITCTSPVVLPSLLERLQASIQSSMGGSSSGASLASERAPLDTGALFEAMKITAQIDSWCHSAKIMPTHQPANDLRAWYVATLSRPADEAREDFCVKQLGKWARSIEAMMDRPREKELPDDCPTCGAKEWWKAGERYHHPLIVRYRPDDPVGSATAMCRFCEKVWNARELAFELEGHAAGQVAEAG